MTQDSRQQAAAEAAVAAHYGMLLGIKSPWQVRRVDLQLNAKRVEVEVVHDPILRWRVRGAGDPVRAMIARRNGSGGIWTDAVHDDHSRPSAALPVSGTWRGHRGGAMGEPHGRFTLMFEAFAVTVIEAARSFVQAMEILRVDWHTIQEIVRRAVERGLLRRTTEAVKQVGMDEKSFGRGQDYVSLMTDPGGRRGARCRRRSRHGERTSAVGPSAPAQRDRVEAVAIDMSAEFTAAARQSAQRAAIVYDKFHVAKHLNEAVDKVRREEQGACWSRATKASQALRSLAPRRERGRRARLSFSELASATRTSRAWFHKETFKSSGRNPARHSPLGSFSNGSERLVDPHSSRSRRPL